MLVKLYNHLHPVGNIISSFTNLDANEDYALDIFQMNSTEIAKEIVTQKLLDLESFMWM